MISFAFSHTSVDSLIPNLKVKQQMERMDEDSRRHKSEEKDCNHPTSTELMSSLGMSL